MIEFLNECFRELCDCLCHQSNTQLSNITNDDIVNTRILQHIT